MRLSISGSSPAPYAPDAEPKISISDDAARALQEAVARANGGGRELHLSVDARFQASLTMAPRAPGDLELQVNGVKLLVDPLSAMRADGIAIEVVDTPRGAGFQIENPNAPGDRAGR